MGPRAPRSPRVLRRWRSGERGTAGGPFPAPGAARVSVALKLCPPVKPPVVAHPSAEPTELGRCYRPGAAVCNGTRVSFRKPPSLGCCPARCPCGTWDCGQLCAMVELGTASCSPPEAVPGSGRERGAALSRKCRCTPAVTKIPGTLFEWLKGLL